MGLKYGAVLQVKRSCGGIPYTHYMIHIGDGKVIHNTRGLGVAVADIAELDYQDGIVELQHDGQFHGAAVVQRAKSLLNKEYNIFKFNCEHFWRRCVGLEAKSPQIRRALAACSAAVCVITVASLANGNRRPVA